MTAYDNAIRDLISAQPHALAEFLLGTTLTPETEVRHGPTELAGGPLRTDAVLLLEGRCLHVEFQLHARPLEIEPRLVAYWSRLLGLYGVIPEQHVVVLNPNGGRLGGQFSRGGLTLRYEPHHLWDLRADDLLALPKLYPLAVLGRRSFVGRC